MAHARRVVDVLRSDHRQKVGKKPFHKRVAKGRRRNKVAGTSHGEDLQVVEVAWSCAGKPLKIVLRSESVGERLVEPLGSR